MGKFIVKKTETGYNFDLKAANGQIIATSQVYASKESAKKGVESVRKNAPIAAIEDQTKEGFAKEKHPKFEIYLDKGEHPRFRLTAANGENIIASQKYASKKNCEEGLASVQKNAPEAELVIQD